MCLKKYISILLFFITSNFFSQDTFTSIQDGTWNDNTASTPWSYSGSDPDGIPDDNDIVIINHNISQPNLNLSIGALTINASGNLILFNGKKLILYDDVINNGQISGVGQLTGNATFEVSGSGTFSSTITWVSNGVLTFKNTSITIDNSITARSGGDFRVGNGANIIVNGPVYSNNGSSYFYVDNGGTIQLNSPSTFLSGLTSSRFFVYNGSKVIFNSNTNLLSTSSNSYGSVEITSGNTLTINNSLSFSNDLIIDGNYNVNPGNTITFNGTSAQTISGSGSSSFKDIVVSNTNNFNLSTGQTINVDGSISCSGNFINNSSLTVNGDITCSGNFENNTSLDLSSSTLSFNGTSQQTFSGTGLNTINNFILNNSNGLVMSADTLNIISVIESQNGTFTHNSGGTEIVLIASGDDNSANFKINDETDYSFTGNSGNITVQRSFSAGVSDWRMLSSPINKKSDGSTADLSIWDDEFIYCGFSGADYGYVQCGNFCSTWFYDESDALDGNTDAGLDSATNISNSVANARGVMIFDGFGTANLSVTGKPELSNLTPSISRGSADAARGYNLIGNPYPCALSFSEFYQDNNSIEDGFIIWDGSSNVYRTYTDASNKIIPHFQGFWVQKSGVGSSNLDFNLAQTVSNKTAAFEKSSNGINTFLEIELINDNTLNSDFTNLFADYHFNNVSNPGKDFIKFFPPYPELVSSLYFERDSLPLSWCYINNNQTVSLDISVESGNQSYGSHTMKFKNLSKFMIGSCITLEDLENGIITDLRRDTIYTFISDSLSLTKRFKLHILKDINIEVNNSTCYQDSNASILITGDSVHASMLYLMDSLNYCIDSIISFSDTVFFSNLNAGIYNLITNDSNNCSLANQEIVITEPNEIISNFSSNFDSLFLDSSYNAEVYFNNLSSNASYCEWDFGDGNSSSSINAYHNFTTPGLFNVTLNAYSDSSKTCSSSYEKNIQVFDNQILNSIRENDSEILKLSCFNNFLTVDIPLFNSMHNSYKILDLNGKCVSKGFISSNHTVIDLSYLKNQYYFFSIKLSESVISNKFLKF